VEFLGTPDTYYDMLAERLPEIRADIARLRSSSVLLDRDEWGYLLQLMHPSTNLELYGRVLCGLEPDTLYI
jgi:4-hydroxyphenylpyruvate dioxygenase-like putative hemolysin